MLCRHPHKAPFINLSGQVEPFAAWLGVLTERQKGSGAFSKITGQIFLVALLNLHVGCKAKNAFFAGVITIIEVAHEKGWRNQLWVETYSSLVILAFKIIDMVPWSTINRQMNCIHLTENMIFFAYHIFHEGNICANRLAAPDTSTLSFCWWNFIPHFIANSLYMIDNFCLTTSFGSLVVVYLSLGFGFCPQPLVIFFLMDMKGGCLWLVVV